MQTRRSAVPSVWEADIAMSQAATNLRQASSFTDPYAGSAVDLTVYVSCYNEAPYIAETLEIVCGAVREVGLRSEIIVIDDCSKDNSREVVRAFITSHPSDNIILRANRRNRGLAQNYVDAALLGSGRYYRMVCGDNCEPKSTLVKIFSEIGKADCIVPVPKYRSGRSLWRLAISNTYTNIINAVTGYQIGYYNGLAVHLRANVLRWHTNTSGFGFQAEILCLILDAGFSYREVIVETHENRVGKSNAINLRNFLSVAHTILEIVNRRLSGIVYARPPAKRIRHKAGALETENPSEPASEFRLVEQREPV